MHSKGGFEKLTPLRTAINIITMQTLNIQHPGMPDLQFVLLVSALCTSGLATLNVSEELRRKVFDSCWALVSTQPPPTNPRERVLDLRFGTELTLDALVATIRQIFADAGVTALPRASLPNRAAQLPSL